MRNTCRRWTAALVAGVTVAIGSVLAQSPEAPPQGGRVATGRVQPLAFEENRGQADARIRYLARARDYTIALTDSDAVLAFHAPATGPGAKGASVVRMRLANASSSAAIIAHEPLPGKVYYAGASATGPLTPVSTFGRIEYRGVYPGVDLVYRVDDRRVEFDFVVAPFADPAPIALLFEGADRLTITDAGDLSADAHGTPLLVKRPVVYQQRAGTRVDVAAGYRIASDGRSVRLRLGDYDPSLPLVVDPTWTTQFGSASEDTTTGLEVDSTGAPHVLGVTFDPATFPFSSTDAGMVPSPNCYLAKFDATSGLPAYTIVFANTGSCGPLAISPNDVVYFTGFVDPNGLVNGAGTTVTAVDDSSGIPTIRRFSVANYDSRAGGGAVAALAVNAQEHLFLLGPCRLVQPGEPPLQLGGYNAANDPPHDIYAEGCTIPGSGRVAWRQPLLTVVDSAGAFLYGSFLSPGEALTRYGMAADDADRAFIVGAQSSAVSPTADAFRGACGLAGSRGFDLCGYLMVLDTTTTAQPSLLYASYLWNTENVETVAVRLNPAGGVSVAAEGRVFDDFPSNRPTDAISWPFSLYPGLRDGIQLARFAPDANGQPNQLDFALVFDPSRAVTALAGQTARDALADLRVFPSGAFAVATTAYSTNLAPLGVVTTFLPDAASVGSTWTQTLATREPAAFAIAPDRRGNLFLAGQMDRIGASDTDAFVEQLDAIDPAGNRAPAVEIMFRPTVVYASDPTGGTIAVNTRASDPDGDPLTYTWTGPFLDHPEISDTFLVARLPLGLHQTITVTVDDGRGGIASASIVVDVIGAPVVGATAVPIDSECGTGFACNYTPVTVTAAAAPPVAAQVFLRTRVDQNPPIPADLQAGSPPVYFDLSTDQAPLAAPIDVCIDTRGMSFPAPGSIRLYQYVTTGPLPTWTDVTHSLAGGQICGRADTLGTFAIFYPQLPVTSIRTIAGNGTLSLNATDFVAGPATATPLNYLYGGAIDRARNLLYISESSGFIDRVDLISNTISRVAGNGILFPGSLSDPADLRDDVIDGGDPFNTFVGGPSEMTVNAAGNLIFFDRQTCRIRRLDFAQNKIFNVAGTGACGYSGDGGPAMSAAVSYGPMTVDAAGNLFLSDGNNARVRRIDAATGIITTVAGNGTFATPVAGAPALSAIGFPQGIAFDAQGFMILAAGGDLLRIAPGADDVVAGDADETITVLGGCHTNCGQPFGGDGLPASHPQLFLADVPSLFVASDGGIVFTDRFRVRRIAPGPDGIVTGAADEIVQTIGGYHDPRPNSISNFNGDTFATQSHLAIDGVVLEDASGRVLLVDGNNYRVRRFGYVGGPQGTGADVQVSVQASPNPAAIGQTIAYTVTVANNGPDVAQSVTLTLPTPAGLTIAGASSPGTASCQIVPSQVTCTVDAVQPGQPLTFTITGSSAIAATLPATFTVAAQTVDPRPANNTASIEVEVEPTADLSVAIVQPADGANVDLGAAIDVDIAVSNLGPSGATPVRLRLPIPAGLAFVSGTIPGGECDGSFGVLVCDLNDLAANATVHASLVMRPTATGPLAATFDVSSVTTDLVPANNAATLHLTVVPAPAVVSIVERVTVADTASILPAAMIGIAETVAVTDQPTALLSAMVGIFENIGVGDTVAATATPAFAPVLSLPGNVVREASGATGTRVTFIATAVDAVDGPVPVTCAPASGSVFPIGPTVVTCSAVDSAGSRSSGTFTVTVVDTTPPYVVVPFAITVNATTTAGANVSYFTVAFDIVDGIIAAPCTPASGSFFAVGTTSVTCTATDAHGNSASRSFTVTVRPFAGAPRLSFQLVNATRSGTVVTVALRVSNVGTAKAASIYITQITARILAGTGGVTTPASPIYVGDLGAGASKTITLVFSPTSQTISEFSVTEAGIYLNGTFTSIFSFSAAQTIFPVP